MIYLIKWFLNCFRKTKDIYIIVLVKRLQKESGDINENDNLMKKNIENISVII